MGVVRICIGMRGAVGAVWVVGVGLRGKLLRRKAESSIPPATDAPNA